MLTTIHLNIRLGIHLTRLSTEGLGPRRGEVRGAHQMLNAALCQAYHWIAVRCAGLWTSAARADSTGQEETTGPPMDDAHEATGPTTAAVNDVNHTSHTGHSAHTHTPTHPISVYTVMSFCTSHRLIRTHPFNTHPFNGPFSGTTQVSRYQKGKTNLHFTEARDSEWQWHQLGHMQVCS